MFSIIYNPCLRWQKPSMICRERIASRLIRCRDGVAVGRCGLLWPEGWCAWWPCSLLNPTIECQMRVRIQISSHRLPAWRRAMRPECSNCRDGTQQQETTSLWQCNAICKNEGWKLQDISSPTLGDAAAPLTLLIC